MIFILFTQSHRASDVFDHFSLTRPGFQNRPALFSTRHTSLSRAPLRRRCCWTPRISKTWSTSSTPSPWSTRSSRAATPSSSSPSTRASEPPWGRGIRPRPGAGRRGLAPRRAAAAGAVNGAAVRGRFLSAQAPSPLDSSLRLGRLGS